MDRGDVGEGGGVREGEEVWKGSGAKFGEVW